MKTDNKKPARECHSCGGLIQTPTDGVMTVAAAPPLNTDETPSEFFVRWQNNRRA